MRTPVIVTLLLLAVSPSRAEKAFAPSADVSQVQTKVGPSPQLVALESLLLQNQEARDAGGLKPELYQAFVSKFRVDLDATMSRVPPTPENKGLHVQILSRLGEKDRRQALKTLTQELMVSPDNPDLLRAQGQILYDQQDFPAAAEAARKAWEASGRTDKAAWGLLKMSEGRSPPKPDAIIVLRPSAALGSKSKGGVSVVDPGASAQAMTFMRNAVDARKQGHLAVAWANAQAAMKADPTSPGVQKFYETVKADVQSRGTRVDEISSAPITNQEPIPSSPLLPLLVVGGAGVTALGLYKVTLSRGTASSEEGLNPSPEVSPEQSRRNYLNSAVLIGVPLVAGALVFGGPRAWRALAPTVSGVLRGGQESFLRVATSQSGALLPEEQAAGEKVATVQKLPWNSWAEYPKVMVNGGEYAKIGERLYTRHAVDHMMPRALNIGVSTEGRGMSPTFVEDVILRGAQSVVVRNGVQRTIHTLGTVQIITEQNGKVVVTVNPFGRGL